MAFNNKYQNQQPEEEKVLSYKIWNEYYDLLVKQLDECAKYEEIAWYDRAYLKKFFTSIQRLKRISIFLLSKPTIIGMNLDSIRAEFFNENFLMALDMIKKVGVGNIPNKKYLWFSKKYNQILTKLGLLFEKINNELSKNEAFPKPSKLGNSEIDKIKDPIEKIKAIVRKNQRGA